jgi:leucyl-tRNA synthetase
MTSQRQDRERYEPQEIEPKWQQRWVQDELYRVRDDDPRPKWYELTMYPYPSGDLHIGHWYAMSPADAHARFRRMQGYNVLHPMGFDAFGLPAENAAIRRGVHPFTWTMSNIENMRGQLKSIGASYDWERELICCLPEYYKWTQWLFLQLFKNGLAYKRMAQVNWCPSCQTVLANEQVVEGACERCDTPVIRRDLEQWFFRITQYADELLDFSKLDWPEKILTMQRNWIGRSEGADVSFDISECGLPEQEIRTFTTRVDTLFGVTYMALSPEHPLADALTTADRKAEMQAYQEQARHSSEIERQSTEREKTGVFLGTYATSRINGERVPIYVSDYVLMSYGTGAVMGVPAHDARDFAFATMKGLLIRVVVAPPDWDGNALDEAYTGEGTMVNSDFANGLPNRQGATAIVDRMAEQGHGRRTVTYRIRDWLISRQRYWGTPIPVVYCDKDGIVAVPEEDLPVLLPKDAEFKPTGESPLKRHEGFVNTTCPQCGGPAQRETDTMDTFVDSSWYYLRYTDPHFDQGAFDPELVRQWCPVDQYTGGAEHAVMHLLYARFFTKALRDVGVLKFDEPFVRLYNQGTILGEDNEKMSKSRGNVVNPDDYVSTLGADAVRIFLMFLGPWDRGGSWSSTGIQGMSRWLNRVWDLCTRDASALGQGTEEGTREVVRQTHKTVKRVVEDVDGFHFNTALAGMMEFTNFLAKAWDRREADATGWFKAVESLVLLLAPLAPYVSEELWERTGHAYSVHQQALPTWDEEQTRDEEVTLVLQVNGKVRDKITVPADLSEEDARILVEQSANVHRHIEGKEVRKVIYVPGRLLNVVVG